MAMAPKENATDHTVWTSVYLDALVSSAFVTFQNHSMTCINAVQIHKFAGKHVFFERYMYLSHAWR